jgi:hypothetical protein
MELNTIFLNEGNKVTSMGYKIFRVRTVYTTIYLKEQQNIH